MLQFEDLPPERSSIAKRAGTHTVTRLSNTWVIYLSASQIQPKHMHTLL